MKGKRFTALHTTTMRVTVGRNKKLLHVHKSSCRKWQIPLFTKWIGRGLCMSYQFSSWETRSPHKEDTARKCIFFPSSDCITVSLHRQNPINHRKEVINIVILHSSVHFIVHIVLVVTVTWEGLRYEDIVPTPS